MHQTPPSAVVRSRPPSARKRVRGTDRDSGLLFLIGLTLPFPVLGIPLNEFFVLSLTSVLGLVFACRRLMRHGLHQAHRAAGVMLLVFVATAVTRHPVTSYVLSVGALALGMLPLTTPEVGRAEMRSLLTGLTQGLWLTVTLMGICIFVQLAGLEGVLGPIAPLLVGTDQTGWFLGYIRPFAGFSEPSHLAIYLASMYVVFDLLSRPQHSFSFKRLVVGLAVVFTGSVSGLLIFVAYLGTRALVGLRRLLVGRFSRRNLLRGVLLVLIAVAAMLSFGPSLGDFTDEYVIRLVKTLDDIETGNLVGSEGSRVNAVLALPDYWEVTGLPGFMFGTGYANHQAWLIDTYGHLNESATFSRGAVDNILIAVFLATGVVGFAAYLGFLVVAFGREVLLANIALVVLVVSVNFSYGYLISGLYWNLLFILAIAGRRSIVSVSHVVIQPKASPGQRKLKPVAVA